MTTGDTPGVTVAGTEMTYFGEHAPSSSGPVPMQDPAADQIVDGPEPFLDNSAGRKTIDLVFIQDATGSMGSYIASARENIIKICDTIITSENLESRDDLRVAIVAYRDHPPQDRSYVTRIFPFTSKIADVQEYLSTLQANGGGDGPEAVTAGMWAAVHNLRWRSNSAKICILIADAPPHGLGEPGDGFPNGDPDGHDPIQIARVMASKGITMFMVACEPALANYSRGVDFFQAVCNITCGLMLPLTTASLLANAIVGSVLENLDMERLVREVGEQVVARIGVNTDMDNIDAVAKELHDHLTLRGDTTKKVQVESIYRDSEESTHNVKVWMECANIQEAKPLVQRLKQSRFSEAYLNSKFHTDRSSYYYRRLPPRPSPPPAPAMTLAEEDDDDDDDIIKDDASSSSSRSPSPSISSPRAEFKPFSAVSPDKGRLSVSGASGAAAPKSGLPSDFKERAAFKTGPRPTRNMADDEDDEDDEGSGGKQRIGLFEDAISLDQARRIAQQSIWRMRA